MTDLKIRVFKNGKSEPDTTVTIPDNILKIASKLIPKKLTEILQDKGVEALSADTSLRVTWPLDPLNP